MTIELLSIFAAISAIMALKFSLKENLKWFSVFKPLTTILIIIIALIIFQKQGSTYSKIIIVALIFALIGDIFLIDNKHFIQGLSSFIFAHIFFIISFTSIFGFYWNLIPLVLLVMIGAAYYSFLRKDLNTYKLPVLLYITVILVMNWQAVSLIIIGHKFIFIALAIASLLFSFSDAIIAFTKFKKDFKTANLLILSTYWIAIYTFTIAGLYLTKM
jgi:uncharacterized membrane protein YhhN